MRGKRLSIGLRAALAIFTVTVLVTSTWAATNWNEKVLHSFNGMGGSSPEAAGLIFDGAGNLYGTTYYGGDYGGGTVFELTPAGGGNWAEKVLHSFGNGTDGNAPNADHLDRSVHHLVMFEQHATARHPGLAVAGESQTDFPMALPSSGTFPVENRRELVFEVRRPARGVHELREEAFGGAALVCLRRALDGAAADPGILNVRDQHVGLEG